MKIGGLMDPNENKAIVRRYFDEIFNRGDLAAIEALLAPSIVFENPPTRVEGHAALKQLVTSLRTAFPDFQFVIEDEIAEGDKVVTRWRLQGTQHGQFLGNPPSHKRFDVTGMDIFQIREGRIARVWVNMDMLGQAQQLGWIPAPQGT
jgi:steroid delta-isomerase-like uncharacterized protein